MRYSHLNQSLLHQLIEGDSAEIEKMPEIADPEPITRRRSKRAAAVAAALTITHLIKWNTIKDMYVCMNSYYV